MYNPKMLCIDRVVFHDENGTVGFFKLIPERFPPFRWPLNGRPISNEIYVGYDLVDGHFTSEYGISVVRGIDQLAVAVAFQSSIVHKETGKEPRLARIEGPIKFLQPVVPGDTMIIHPSNLGENALKGDCEITVNGSSVATFVGIQFGLVEVRKDNYIERAAKEAIKPSIIEGGAQTEVADLRRRIALRTPAEQTIGDFLIYTCIRGPVEFYEDILPGGTAEIHVIKDSQDPNVADFIVWVDGRKIAEIRGNECAVGNIERMKLLTEKITQRRRSRVKANS